MTALRRITPEQRRVLDELVRQEALTRAQLAERTALSRNTVGSRLTELEAAGWVSSAEAESSGGRPAMVYSIAPERSLVFVCAFGVTHVVWALATLGGRVIAREEGSVDMSLGAQRTAIVAQKTMARMLHATGRPDDAVHCVAVGLPSPIGQATHGPIQPGAMPGWIGVDAAALFEEQFALPVALENDAKLMALGVQTTQPGVTENLVFIKVASGAGAGLILRGELQSGDGGLAGEIGHIPLTSGTRPCDCGNVGCISRYSTISGIAASLRELGVPAETLADISALVARGEPNVPQVLRQAGRYLGEIAAILVGITNPGAIMLGGSLVSMSDELITGMREVLYARSIPALTSELRTVVVPDHDGMAIHGGVRLAMREMLDRASESS